MGIETEFYDPWVGANIEALMRPNTRLVFVESPGSLTFEVQDVPAIADVAHRHGALVVADSTWATPLGWDAFALGIDVSIHAATKYIVGHSDVMLGAILCNEACYDALRRFHWTMGITVGSDDAYLALRGLRTLSARLAIHAVNAKKIADWLLQQAEVDVVLYPPIGTSPGHALWARDFHAQYACGLMGVQFKSGVDATQVAKLADTTRLFGIGYSWGGYESLILPVKPARLRAVTADRWEGRELMRLHIGLEDPADLIEDLAAAFAAMRSA
jgi:cystathionine beta-lyase